ncbi:hypothetical protein KNU66_gp10 [Gordonia phage McKinley]|uniref:Uncharacterized protein n=1 Tax=Gordonia phage McKinley TaxID=2588507 RepID=A0A4Y6ELU3_9CAUD|nr:hypothetical protein KNU66_gp10 [Gordonia phage McKinley]QDF19432.1 hypothetical protein SEA_MCKINLEY_10 [Gordonia phage McKinley]
MTTVDTPSPAEIVKRFLPPLPGRLGDVQAGKLLAGLAEHYQLLPKSALRDVVEDARNWKPYETRDIGEAVAYSSFTDLIDELAALAADV